MLTEADLRDYQRDSLNEVRSLMLAGRRRILIVAPTGSGKGTLCSIAIRNSKLRGKRTLFLVNRQELVKDMSRRLDRLGLEHGIIMAGHPRRWAGGDCHVGSVQTIQSREVLDEPDKDVIFVDEAHFAASPGWERVLARYPNAYVIGMTATPVRLDGKGLRIFSDMVNGPSYSDLVVRGFLVPTKVYAPTTPNMKGVKKQAGEYNQKQAAERVDTSTIVGDIVDHWFRLARGRPTVAFACNVKHSQHIVKQFRDANIRAVHVDAHTPSDVRDRTWRALEDGDLDVVSNVGIISYGWDCPPVSCLILARPTASLALHIQQCGRVSRAFAGKQHGLILDHAGNTLEHGFLEDHRDWSLSDGLTVKEGDDGPKVLVRTCTNCLLTFRAGPRACPQCGHTVEVQNRTVTTVDGELGEILPERWYLCRNFCWKGSHRGDLQSCPKCGSQVIPLASKYDRGGGRDEQKRCLRQLALEGRHARYKPNWAGVQFKIRFGFWPPRKWLQEAHEQSGQPHQSAPHRIATPV